MIQSSKPLQGEDEEKTTFSRSLTFCTLKALFLRQGALSFILSCLISLANAAELERMTVGGNTLIFNTDALAAVDNSTPTIIYEDVNLFGGLLMEHPEVETVVVSGAGGSTSAAYEIAHKITEFGLTTVARNNCSSACTLLFLAGTERRLEKGARLGFHRIATSASEHREFYERNREDAGWEDEFGYAKKVHEDGQIAARTFIAYVLSRGVSVDFALEALTYSPSDMWHPSLTKMLEAGILNGE